MFNGISSKMQQLIQEDAAEKAGVPSGTGLFGAKQAIRLYERAHRTKILYCTAALPEEKT